MRRREFVGLLGGAAVWPAAAHAQGPGKLPTIGYLGGSTPAAQSQWTAAFVQRLRELGWSEGGNIAIEYRWAEGRVERLAEIAAELVRLKVDIIVAAGTAGSVAAKQATAVIPIVFPAAGDPVAIGLVASPGRPGGNATGLSQQQTDLATKRHELLREVVPGLRRLAVMANIAYPAAVLEMSEIQTAAGMLRLQAATLEIRRFEDIAIALEPLNGSAEALYVCGDPRGGRHFPRPPRLSPQWPFP